nr:hypothetical protein [uncultured Duncaniella sp.]
MKPVKLAARIALSLGIAASATAITMTSCTEQRANPFMEPYGKIGRASCRERV